MNVLILAAGQPDFSATGNNYPLSLAEHEGVPLIQRLIENCAKLSPQVIVAMRAEDIRNYHLDNIVTLLAPNATHVSVSGKTKGAACTALLASGAIDNDDELLILNTNEILFEDYAVIVQSFRDRKLDAGVVSFSSVHPRYSYVRLNEEGLVIEAAEKRPLSNNATVGFYWFARGKDFVGAVKSMIRKDASVNELFYICPSLNELILQQAKVGVFHTDAANYRPIKNERQLQQYETAQPA